MRYCLELPYVQGLGYLWVSVIGMSVAVGAVTASPDTPTSAEVAPIRINVAEAIIEPFWSPELSGFAKWRVDAGTQHGLAIKQNWSAVDFEWASKPETGPALRMTRDFNVDCTGYDRLLVKLAAPAKTVVRITGRTDKGEIAFSSNPTNGKETEHAVDLQGARRIDTLTLEIETGEPGGACGWLRWIGLQNTEMLKQYLARWDYSRMRWDAYLKDASFTPEFKPVYGIFMTDEELDALRAQHAESMRKEGKSRYTEAAESARKMEFEKGIHEFAKTGGKPDMHGRIRDQDLAPLPGGPSLAVAGLVLKDAETLRAAARFALSLAMSEHWEEGFMSCFPGGPWEDRAFRRSYCCEDIAEVLDLAGEVFTDAGRIYLMRRLAEEGIGPINYVTWRHEYIFHCNQLAFFNRGRMYAYLVLERERPRVKPYTELAYQDSVDNLRTVILPDGGYGEGPSYFTGTVNGNYEVLKHYARARGKPVASLMPDVLKQTANLAAVVASTTKDDVIPICDADAELRGSSLKVLHELVPGSYWTTLYNKHRTLAGEAPLPEQGPPLPAFISLPDMGPMASLRTLDGQPVKVFIMGNKADATHTHEDKGSFVLEFAGETFAMDLGICDYDDPIHNQYKQCQRHNMLAPVGMPERAHPQSPLPFDVKPAGNGNEKEFHATIDATPGWEGYYKKWVRTWDSPSPDILVIRDEYEVAKGDGVEFYWQTNLSCAQEGHVVTITGARGAVRLNVPEDCQIRIDTLPLFGGKEQHRIAIRKGSPAGIFEVTVRLNSAGNRTGSTLYR